MAGEAHKLRLQELEGKGELSEVEKTEVATIKEYLASLEEKVVVKPVVSSKLEKKKSKKK